MARFARKLLQTFVSRNGTNASILIVPVI